MTEQAPSAPEAPAAEATETTTENTAAETQAQPTSTQAAAGTPALSSEATDKAVKAIEQAAKTGPNEFKKYKVKIDGQEMEVTEKELLSGYQRATAAQKRFDDAAKMRKQNEQFINLLKKDPVKVLSHPDIGHDVRKLAEEYLAGELRKESLSPEQRELEELRTKLRESEEKDKAAAETAKQQEFQKLQSYYEEDYTSKIVKALETSGLPKTPSTVSRMAQYMLRANEQGYEVEPTDVVTLVKEDYMGDVKALFGSLDGDTLISLLGKDVVNKIKKTEIEKIKSKTPANPTQTKEVAKPTAKSEDRPSKKMSWDDYKRELEEKYLK